MTESSADSKILGELEAIAGKQLGYSGSLEPGMRLVEDLDLDSMRLLTLAVAVEDHFLICLDEDDEHALVTVGDLVAAVGRKLGPGGGDG